jgi:hypothetical protein
MKQTEENNRNPAALSRLPLNICNRAEAFASAEQRKSLAPICHSNCPLLVPGRGANPRTILLVVQCAHLTTGSAVHLLAV